MCLVYTYGWGHYTGSLRLHIELVTLDIMFGAVSGGFDMVDRTMDLSFLKFQSLYLWNCNKV